MNNYTVVDSTHNADSMITFDEFRKGSLFCEAILPNRMSTNANYIVVDSDTKDTFHTVHYGN